jgi:hypothetical protein
LIDLIAVFSDRDHDQDMASDHEMEADGAAGRVFFCLAQRVNARKFGRNFYLVVRKFGRFFNRVGGFYQRCPGLGWGANPGSLDFRYFLIPSLYR